MGLGGSSYGTTIEGIIVYFIHFQLSIHSKTAWQIECYNLDWVGDGFCDDDTNNVECGYDGGDCCGPNTIMGVCSKCLCFGLEGSSYGTTMPHTITFQGSRHLQLNN